MNSFLPLMNYGDQIARDDFAPLINQAGAGATGYAAPGNQIVGGVVPGGLNGGPTVQSGIMAQPGIGSTTMPVILPNAMPNQGYSPCNCNGKKESPFENETVQYALLFALLYVVIKKL